MNGECAVQWSRKNSKQKGANPRACTVLIKDKTNVHPWERCFIYLSCASVKTNYNSQARNQLHEKKKTKSPSHPWAVPVFENCLLLQWKFGKLDRFFGTNWTTYQHRPCETHIDKEEYVYPAPSSILTNTHNTAQLQKAHPISTPIHAGRWEDLPLPFANPPISASYKKMEKIHSNLAALLDEWNRIKRTPAS